MTTVHHRYATVHGRRISDLVSFDPDKVTAHLDGTRLRLEPGQTVIPYGSTDRYFDADEATPAGQP